MTRDSVDIDETDRPRGILSKADRKYLTQTLDERKENYTRQGRSNRKRNIRERLRNGLLDMDLILRGLELDVLEQAFDAEQENSEDSLPTIESLFGDLEARMAGALAVIYLAVDQVTEPGEQDEYFEFLLKRAIWKAKAIEEPDSDHIALKYSVRFDVIGDVTVDVAKIANKIRSHSLQELTEDEMRFYIHVQERSESTTRSGEDAAKEFLEQLRTLEESDVLKAEGDSET